MVSKASYQKKFGKNVKKIRLEKKFSQERLAYNAELSVFTISQIELGKLCPLLTTAHQIAKALGVSLSELTEDIEI
ncbi:MAG: helix-turn-helix transcriptional regulator [bacterium]